MGEIKSAIKKSTKYNKGESLASFKLASESPSTQIEPIYYWLLDFLEGFSSTSLEKITDNFSSSPGSAQFAEMGQRATKMQEEGMKILGLINQVIRTILNLVYDLKEFEIRLHNYEDANSPDQVKKNAGTLALKQVWLDNVDMKKGRGSIHQMTYELGYTTLRESFMIANTLEDVEKNPIINDSVKRIVLPRLSEFLTWKEYSEKELKKRFEIERSYLKTEIESLKLYTSWAMPYLKAAEELRMKGFEKNPALVNAFSTTMFELVLFGKSKVNFESSIKSKKLPPGFLNYHLKRNYYSCFVINLKYRGHLGQRVDQKGNYGFAFGGKLNITFDSYALNDDELKFVYKELENQDLETSFNFLKENTQVSLDQLKEDIDHFLGEEQGKKREKKEEKRQDDINPFSALFGLFKPKKQEEKKKEIKEVKEIPKDNYVEQEVRKLAVNSAKNNLYVIYDVYKKSHGMASSPTDFDAKA